MRRARALGLDPRKALGQHFLLWEGVARRMVDSAEVGPQDTAVEVGPGLGALTRLLVERAGRVVAVELDPDLARLLPALLGNPPNLRVVQADARQVDPRDLVGNAPYKVVASLPYYAANPILRRFLEAEHRPLVMVVMVQWEVARQMCARPGEMTLLSVAVQFHADARILMRVPPSAFHPRPRVSSAVVRLDPLPAPRVPVDDADRFFALVRAGFQAPRKQLRRGLADALGLGREAVESALRSAGIAPERRPETLSLEEWGRLYLALRDRLP